MTLIPWQTTVQNQFGVVQPSPVITVRDSTGALASLFTSGGVALSNPLTGNTSGFVQFWTYAGRYTITGTLSGSDTYSWTIDLCEVPNWGPNPASVSDIIAWCAANNSTTVTLKKILGSTFNQATDDAAPIFNNVLSGLAAARITIIDPDGMDLLFNSQVTYYSYQEIIGTKGATVFRRNYTQTGVNNATFTSGGDTRLTNVFFKGITFDVAGGVATMDIAGHHLKFYCDNSRVEDCDFLNHFQGAASFIRGDNGWYRNVRSITDDLDPGGDTDSSAAGFRISEGDNFWVYDFTAIGPNDQAMLVLGMQDDGTDVIRNCGYINGYVQSFRAKAATCGASQNGGAVVNFLGGIYDCLFQNIHGSSGRYGLRTVADGSDRKNTIHNVTFRDINITVDHTGNENIDGNQIKGLEDTVNGGGSVGDIIFDNVSCYMTAARYGFVMDAPGGRLFANNFAINGERIAARFIRGDLAEFRGNVNFTGPATNATEVDPDADGGDRSPVKIEDTFTGGVCFNCVPTLLNVSTPTIAGVPKYLSGFRVKGGTLELPQGAIVYKTTGASSGTKFARVTGTGTLIIGAPTRGDITTWLMDGDGHLVNTVQRVFPTRADAVAFATSTTDLVQLGATITIGSLIYQYDSVSTSVVDMPGWVLISDGARKPIYGQLNAGYTLTSTTAYQKLFNLVTNGAITLETGRYSFELVAVITSMSATSGNATFSLLGAGTAVVSRVLQHSVGADQGNPQSGTPVAQTGTFSNAETMGGTLAVAGTAAGVGTELHGMFNVTTAGTIIPSISLVTAAAANVEAGSYIRITRLGDTGSNYTSGSWS